MTPSARISAAIEILDNILDGRAAEQALTRWARASRFAGSKDRAAVRDHVFDVLRQKQSAALLGGGVTGRSLMVGVLRAQGVVLEDYFTGIGHAPQPLPTDVIAALPSVDDAQSVWNLPEWILPEFERSLVDEAFQTARALQDRAPVCLRVNLKKSSRMDAAAKLRLEGIETVVNSLSPTALSVVHGARGLRNSDSYTSGLVELQDAASQAVVDCLPAGRNCLDFCAGGGGKALALAAQPGRVVSAHDRDVNRMKDIAPRAARAGLEIVQLETTQLQDATPFDLVLCDAPCSGSGAWRRSPGGKWSLTPDKLLAVCTLQDEVLAQAAALVGPGGTLAYATCSVLRCENEDRIEAFQSKTPGWTVSFQRRFDVCPEGDGFFTAHLTRR